MEAGESVYRLVPPPAEAAVKPPLHRSKHPGAVSPKAVPCSSLGVKTVRAAATMGPGSGALLVSPDRFLRAHEREPVLPPRESAPLPGSRPVATQLGRSVCTQYHR